MSPNGGDPESVSLCSHLTSQKNPSSSSCTVCYLMNSCGLTEKQALIASKKLVNFKTASNPDTVLTLFQDYGFTKPDVSKIISKSPLFLLSDAHKSFKPKLDFFISKDISRPDVINCITTNPRLLKRSLENHIIPYFDSIKSIVGADKFVFAVMRRSWFPPESIEKVELNVQALRDVSVPESAIIKFLISQPRTFTINIDRFKQVVQEVKSVGFDDPHTYGFIRAIHAIASMTKSSWETKLNVYRECGWSEKQIQRAFKSYPMCMTVSEKKISKTMDYLVNQMGFSPSLMARHPSVLSYILENRIIPRCSVYRSLLSKGLIKVQALTSLIYASDQSFLDNFVVKYGERAAELMKIYKDAFNGHVMDEGVQGCALKNIEDDESEEEEEIDAVPLNEKVLDDSQASVLQKEVGLEEVNESKKVKNPTEVMKKSKKKKVIKKVKEKVEALEDIKVSAKKKEKDKAKKKEEVMAVVCAVPMDAEVLEDSQASLHKKKVCLDKVVESKKDKKPKKVSKKSKTKVEEVQSSVAKKEEDIDPEPVSLCSHLTSQKNPSSSSFVVSYLMNSCGLTEKQALIASKKLNFKTTSNPDTVLAFFQDYEFTKSDIAKLITREPSILSSDVHKTLKPKLDYFISKEVSRLEVIKVLSANPHMLTRSLENYIIPLFDFIKNIVGTDKNVLSFFRCSRCPSDAIERLKHNIEVLRDEGVPQSNIVNFLVSQPIALTISTLKFKEIVPEIKGMGFDPSKTPFLFAIHAIRSMTKATWETKLNAYRKWGWSEEQIHHAFLVCTLCMTHSEKKISGTMDFLVNQMGISSLHIARYPHILSYSLEKRIIPRSAVYQSLVAKGLINEGQFPLRSVLYMTEESFLKKFVLEYQEKAPELMKIYKQALSRRVMDEGVQDSALKNEEEDMSEEEEEIAVVPLDEKVLDDSQVSVPEKKVGLDAVEESMKAIWPKKVMKESKKKKVVKKLKKKVEELAVVCMSGKELEDSESSVPKMEVGIDKVEVSKKAKGPKEAFKKKFKKKVAETQDSGAVKYVAEAPGLLQESDSRVMEDSQSEEVAVCPERDAESVAALPKVAKVVDKSQAGKPKKKASSSAVVEQEEELKRIEEKKKVKKPKKVLKKPKKEVEDVQGSVAKKEVEDESKQEEEIVTVPIIGKILEDSHSSVLKRKLVLDTVEELKKVKRAKKLMKKTKNKVEEEQCSGAKKEEHEKSKEQDEVVAVSMVGKVLEDRQAIVLECKVSLDEMDESNKVKKLKKASKKQEQKANEVQGSVAIKYDVEVPKLLQASDRPVTGDSQNEESTFYPERATGFVAGVLKETKLVVKTQAGKPNKKASSSDLVKQGEELWKEEVSRKAKKRKKDLKKIKKTVDEVQGSALELLQESDSRVMKDSHGKEVAVCPERDPESVAALPKVVKVVDKSQDGKPKKKASSSHLVEQEEELKKIEDTKKAKKLKKVLKKAKKKVEDVHGGVAKKAEEDKSDEVVVAVPIIKKILEDGHSSVLKRKLVLDTVEETKKVKRAKKLLKKSKKKLVEEQCSAAKKEEHDKSKEEDEVAVVSMVEKVLEDSQASALKSKVTLDEVEELKKAKKVKKVLKKREKKANEEHGCAPIKDDLEIPELLQASNRPFTEDSKNEEVTFCPERATESVAGLLKVAKLVVKSQTGKPNKKASSSDLVKQEEELWKEEVSKKSKERKKDLKKIKKIVEEVPGSAPELLQESDSRFMKDSLSEEVAFCPERDAESVAISKVGKVVDKSQGGKSKKKASLSDLVEQEEEVKKIEETKKARKLKKVLKKAKKKVEDVQGSAAKKEEENKSEEVVVVIPIIKKILEDSHSSVLKRKLVLETVEETEKVKRAKKLLKKSEIKVKEEQCSGAKKKEHDKSKEEDEVAAVCMVEKVLEDSSKVFPWLKESMKAKKIQKALEKREKKANQVSDFYSKFAPQP